MQPTVRDHALTDGLRAGQAAVEEGLLRATKSDVPFITEAARELTRTAGRRLRPLLVLLAARFGDPGAPGVVPAAVVVELTHLATHYHDDVRDEAAVRRDAPRPDANWDNTVAVLTGDFLFARASHILADLGPEAVRIQAQAFRRQVTGQILETTGPRDGRDPVEHHLDVLASRTGSLTAVSGRLGALASGADPSVADALARYGERLGVASHLADEVATPTARRPTLPVLLLARVANPAGPTGPTGPTDRELYELLTGPAERAGHAEAVARLRTHPVLDRAREETARQADAARAALSTLPDSPARDALESLCETVVAPTAPSSCG
ncbi:polyprenyl synthetase family protein [Streptomyces rapamycinicus]|uniref:Geranylgeranyl pyrophosphate synthase n=2 Tax=Streptomyces rapamycinicus TaxID=1226757 RepID=A0A0A0NQS9_STRRN|nr:polyprenyl synthetase family protein [Streptomyces rapamycinicus]AGP56850.1 geranylgeranyl pyrophosphate synthase [Streptomyces rapamycinicus NRRL 5491]MBB4784470.1 heptaprenyl diphosphate synthase [Streptomyces rapamycinicus]RLV80047.1 geranylgeranyl pyrophosphate synthase [Streptomyces rapamycinicus NRRL 5491]UTO64776.1 polyprenyl synthetase family protein [Streptomyces rapamycinicus]UTP32733.1 polyprenyl synthetase family protein [Streptomyces rapamycinicus NRRL 5491]